MVLFIKNPKAKFVKGDLVNDTDIKKIEKWRPQIIYHLAEQSGGESAYLNPEKDYLSNSGSFKKIIFFLQTKFILFKNYFCYFKFNIIVNINCYYWI